MINVAVEKSRSYNWLRLAARLHDNATCSPQIWGPGIEDRSLQMAVDRLPRSSMDLIHLEW
jgi:hypothetical protein